MGDPRRKIWRLCRSQFARQAPQWKLGAILRMVIPALLLLFTTDILCTVYYRTIFVRCTLVYNLTLFLFEMLEASPVFREVRDLPAAPGTNPRILDIWRKDSCSLRHRSFTPALMGGWKMESVPV